MNQSRARFVCAAIFGLAFALAGAVPIIPAETVEKIIAAAKKEGDEIVFVAGSQTFGGKKGLTELEAAFNKKFHLTAGSILQRREALAIFVVENVQAVRQRWEHAPRILGKFASDRLIKSSDISVNPTMTTRMIRDVDNFLTHRYDMSGSLFQIFAGRSNAKFLLAGTSPTRLCSQRFRIQLWS